MKTAGMLRAFTLAEMLVVMIISGIIFIALFEGVGLIKRYNIRMEGQIREGNSLFEGFRCLDVLFRECDSVCGESSRFVFFREEREWVVVERMDSLLVCSRGESRDTLFRSVAGFGGAGPEGSGTRVDSLRMVVVWRGKDVQLSFDVPRRGGHDERVNDLKIRADEVE